MDLNNLNIEDLKAKVLTFTDKKTLIKSGIAFGAIVFFLIIYYSILNPIVNSKKIKLDDMIVKQNEIIEFTKKIKANKSKIKKLEPDYEKYSTLFHGLRTTIDNYFGKINHSSSPSLQIDSVPLSRELITLGNNYAAIFPESTCGLEFPSSAFAAIPMTPALSRSLYIAYWTNKAKDPDILAVVKNIKNALKKIPQRTERHPRKKAAN